MRWNVIRGRTFGVGVIVGVTVLVAGPGQAGVFAQPAGQYAHRVAPNAVGSLDCNHYSTKQKAVSRKLACTDIHGLAGSGNANAWGGRFYDNGHYIGHDEPMVTYLSNQAGAGNNVNWTETLPMEPAALPAVARPGHDVTHTFELSIAPWFSMALCDPGSYPQLPCSPESDGNAPNPSCLGAFTCNKYPGAGSAFMELQFYPPGFAPFVDGISCDNKHWCSALTIDSLECTDGFASCNGQCIEPVNFAFIQRNGVPAAPPSPQQSNLSTVTQNAHTLLMNPGDQLQVSIADAPVPFGGGNALKTVVNDVTTGQTGFMQASAANGFMSTSIVDCSGVPFNFEPEYSTAGRDNIVPWAADQVDIATQFEIGHFEPCTSTTGGGTVTISGQTDAFQLSCHGPYEDAAPGGDGGNGSPEALDAFCYNKGDTHSGLIGSHAPDEVTGCIDTITQNGDIDFDGSDYWADWPNSTTANTFPSTFLQGTPHTAGGMAYPQFFFQTDAALSESTCTAGNLNGCAVPPPNAPGNFYPYWTRTASCVWEFGNMTNGTTFGKDKQYGTVRAVQFGYPQIISKVYTNTCT